MIKLRLCEGILENPRNRSIDTIVFDFNEGADLVGENMQMHTVKFYCFNQMAKSWSFD